MAIFVANQSKHSCFFCFYRMTNSSLESLDFFSLANFFYYYFTLFSTVLFYFVLLFTYSWLPYSASDPDRLIIRYLKDAILLPSQRAIKIFPNGWCHGVISSPSDLFFLLVMCTLLGIVVYLVLRWAAFWFFSSGWHEVIAPGVGWHQNAHLLSIIQTRASPFFEGWRLSRHQRPLPLFVFIETSNCCSQICVFGDDVWWMCAKTAERRTFQFWALSRAVLLRLWEYFVLLIVLVKSGQLFFFFCLNKAIK